MRNNHKWLVLLLAVVLLVNTMGVSAMAAQSESPVALYVSPAADPNTVQVQATVAEPLTVADGKLVVTYDADVLTCTGAEVGGAWAAPEQVVLSVNQAEGKVILAFASADAAAEGVLFTLTFTGSGDAVIAIDGSSSYISGFNGDLTQEVSTCPSAKYADMKDMVPVIHEAVDYMVAKGYMNGMSDTAFGPTLELNRAMMVTILYRIAGAPEVEGTPDFTDVPAGEFYTAPVVWAVENGITNGVSASLFAPGKALTRQELVTFLYRFATHMQYDVTATTDLSAYTDADKIQPYALEAFQWAVASGVVNGTSETTLHPENTTTRAQICIMVSRLLKAQD